MASDFVVAEDGAALGSLITEDRQIEWRGMLMGPGSFFGYKKFNGWEDLPGVDSSSVPIPRSHGTFPGTLLMNDKIVTFETQMYSGDQFATQLRMLRERTNVKDEDDALIVRQHGETLLAWARITGRALPIDRNYFQGFPTGTIQWTLSDPRRYSLEEHAVVVAPVSETGGLDWGAGLAWGAGLDWGSIVGGTSPVVNNAGTADSPPVIKFFGPLSGPFMLYADDWHIGFNMTLVAGEVLTVDTRTGSTDLNGIDRLYALAAGSNIPEDCILPPGDTTLTLVTADASNAGYASVIWRDAID